MSDIYPVISPAVYLALAGAHGLACTLPCRRFTAALASADARWIAAPSSWRTLIVLRAGLTAHKLLIRLRLRPLSQRQEHFFECLQDRSQGRLLVCAGDERVVEFEFARQ